MAVEEIEPTKDEIRNGWTARTLAAYMRERDLAAAARNDPHSPQRRVKPDRANAKYSPHNWRR